jgi:acyl-CoA synthetase (AMP-forming)/AMP-acid ligase II
LNTGPSGAATPDLETPPGPVNVARLLARQAELRPEQDAVVTASGARADAITWHHTSFAELNDSVDRLATGMRALGVERGERVCVFVKPSAELVALVFALFRLGAVPVVADPGMGRRSLLACIERVRPSVFVGIPLAQVARLLSPRAFRSVRISVTVGKRLAWGGPTLAQLLRSDGRGFHAADTRPEDPAAILFTSGSTGPPKGVLYTHGNFAAQVAALGELYAFEAGEVDLACFPLFALFDAAFGMTSVFPPLDPRRPARCDPELLVRAIRERRPSLTFGSPAIWRRVVPWCLERGLVLEGLKRVMIAGAPVPPSLIEGFRKVLPEDAEVHTPYGATEALPVASVTSRELLGERFERTWAGAGTCVGRPAPDIELRLLPLEHGALSTWSEARELPLGRPGEVCVRGAVVTEVYAEDVEATRSAKLRDEQGRVWHRMGDVGRIDEQGYLWFLGRKAHRLDTERGPRLPVPVENVFNRHPRVHRTALVGVGEAGQELPLLVVEALPGEAPRGEAATRAFLSELRALGRSAHASSDIELFLFHPGFPVDVRHNAKIDREELARWARRQLG